MHARRDKNEGIRKMTEMLPTLLILERRTLVVQRTKEEQGPKERRESVSIVIG